MTFKHELSISVFPEEIIMGIETISMTFKHKLSVSVCHEEVIMGSLYAFQARTECQYLP